MDISKPLRTWSLMSIVVFFALVHAVSASSNVDCSSVVKWSGDASYQRGDLVVRNAGDAEYKCIDAQCNGNSDATSWHQVGVCK